MPVATSASSRNRPGYSVSSRKHIDHSASYGAYHAYNMIWWKAMWCKWRHKSARWKNTVSCRGSAAYTHFACFIYALHSQQDAAPPVALAPTITVALLHHRTRRSLHAYLVVSHTTS
ncbi:hypothetical protein BAUCODRAFT_127445 [Baudoinia panamericana UAMH 10762]|uniref:Uncharacterized protein n=1 Tax=Baudoinia panamericana (strain UAMH 10762) TaxID=717646 RepID=M2LAV2_BAUPA|nr:uncharacterized protein BAUCODRAFT_127445 [Baudoinia panamericana UAMH 10762]EMC90942.1 hypothetical protein BAUCODRAFT_127445 [Baudoinia panamericana UAMH 10762]